MRLIQCHVENFGKLHDQTFDFKQDWNLFSEENGWGKSTLVAFVRVMFFGFEGETKRKNILENERRRYQPWQGGVYGGQMIFETGGKSYIVHRIFGERASQDLFTLRDADTNIVSNDFSSNIGEELFQINSESFMRTIFISQNEKPVSAVTDSIQAKIGNLADSMDDLNQYNRADTKLADMLNKMSPERKTGQIFKMEEQLAELRRQVSDGENLERQITAQQQLLAECRAAQADVMKVWQSMEHENSSREAFSLTEDERAQLEKYDGEFQKGVPHTAELQDMNEKNRRLMAQRRELMHSELSEEEAKRLAQYREEFGEADDPEERVQTLMQQWHDAESAAESEKKHLNVGGVLTILVGIALAAVGVFLLMSQSGVIPEQAEIALPFAGVVLIVVGCLTMKKKASGNEQRQKELQEHEAELKQKVTDAVSYKDLLAKEARLFSRSEYAECMQMEAEIHDFLEEFGYHVEEAEFTEMLSKVGQDAAEYHRLREKQERHGKFDENYGKYEDALCEKLKVWYDTSGQKNPNGLDTAEEETADDGQTGKERQRQYLLRTFQPDQIRVQISQNELQLENLRSQYDEWCESKRRQEELQEELRQMKIRYRRLRMTKQLLSEAKESLTSRYRDPILDNFAVYYKAMTGRKAAGFHMDAEMNITVDEYGMQRDVAFLSSGYQELINLCLRLSLVDAMYQKEKPFLILDDPFVNLDDQKLESGINLLQKISERYQILYFTCRTMATETEKTLSD